MTRNIYAIVDLKAHDLAGEIFTQTHDQIAIRQFADAVSNEKSILHRHPQDFALFRMGEILEQGIAPPDATKAQLYKYIPRVGSIGEPELIITAERVLDMMKAKAALATPLKLEA